MFSYLSKIAYNIDWLLIKLKQILNSLSDMNWESVFKMLPVFFKMVSEAI